MKPIPPCTQALLRQKCSGSRWIHWKGLDRVGTQKMHSPVSVCGPFFFFRCIVDVQQLCEDKSRDQQNVDYWSGFFMAEGLSSPGPSCMGSA